MDGGTCCCCCTESKFIALIIEDFYRFGRRSFALIVVCSFFEHPQEVGSEKY